MKYKIQVVLDVDKKKMANFLQTHSKINAQSIKKELVSWLEDLGFGVNVKVDKNNDMYRIRYIRDVLEYLDRQQVLNEIELSLSDRGHDLISSK